MSVKIFSDLVEISKVVERLECANKMIKNHGAGSSGSKKRFFQEESSDEPHNQQKQFKSQQTRGGSVASGYATTTQDESQTIKCFRCGGPHYISSCSKKSNVCFNCQRPGHLARDCREPSKPVASVSAMRSTRSTATGRILIARGVETSKSEGVNSGECIVSGKPSSHYLIHMLFNLLSCVFVSVISFYLQVIYFRLSSFYSYLLLLLFVEVFHCCEWTQISSRLDMSFVVWLRCYPKHGSVILPTVSS